jgi:hypothetical protein
MSKFLILLKLLVLNTFICIAQQCGMQNYSAIILNIKSKDVALLSNLKITLCNYKGEAYTTLVNTTNDESKNKPYLDSFTFWKNTANLRVKAKPYNNGFYRNYYEGAGNNYICIVPSFSGKNDLLIDKRNILKSEAMFNTMQCFLYVKIESKNQPAKIVKIPSKAIYNVCLCHLYSSNTMCNVKPIDIELFNNRAICKDYRFGMVQVNISELAKETFEDNHEPVFYKVYLIDEVTENIIQSIPSNSKNQTYKDKIAEGNELTTFDFYRNNSTHLPLLLKAKFIQSEFKNKNNNSNNSNIFIAYFFDTIKNKYVIDTLLSNKDYLNINREQNVAYATNITENATQIMETHYKFLNGKWQYHNTEIIKKNIASPILPITKVPNPKPNCYFVTKQKYLPLQYFNNGNTTTTIKDSFIIANYGNATAKLKLTNNNYFTAPATIAPNTYATIYYNRTFQYKANYTNQPFENYQEVLHVEYDSGKTITAGLLFDFINNRATLKNNTSGGKTFYLKENEHEFYVVATDNKGFVQANGKMRIADSSLVGKWLYIDSATGSFVYKQHQKAASISLLNNNEVPLYSLAFNYQNDSTMYYKPVDITNTQTRIYVNNTIKKIVVRIDSTKETAEYNIDFNELEQENVFYMQLLKPTDSFYYDGKQKRLLNFNPTQYHINWQPIVNTINNEEQYEKNLLYKYPKIIVMPTNRFSQISKIDLINYSNTEQKNILNYLQADTTVNYIAQLWNTTRDVYCDNRIYIIVEAYTQQHKHLDSLAKLCNFSYNNTHANMSNNSLYFNYHKKLVNQAFINDFNKLVKLLNYKRIFLSTYMKVDLDNIIKPNKGFMFDDLP